MELFGLTIARAKSLEVRVKALMAAALSSVPGSRGWFPIIRETSAGAWQRNEDVAVETAFSNPTLYSCLTLLSGDMGKMRLKLVEQDEEGIWHEVDSSAFSPFIRKPNHYQTRADFYEWWTHSKLSQGNTYMLKARDGRNVVRAGHILDPSRVTPLVAPDSSVFYELQVDELAGLPQSIIVPAREIIHDRVCPLFHPLVGVSPIYAAGFPAVDGLTTRRTSGKFFANGSKPGGVLTAPGPISPETAKRSKDYWETEFKGDNIGKIAVLGEGLHYEAMAATAEQSQLVEQLALTDADIARCFLGGSMWKVGIGPMPAEGKTEALNKMYLADSLQKHIVKAELCLDEGLELVNVPGRRLGVEFERDDLFEMDTDAQMEAAEKAIKSGATVNEVRKRFHGYGPVEGGDEPYLQEQNWPVRLLGQRQLPPEPSDRTPTPPGDKTAPQEKAYSYAEISAARAEFKKRLAA